MKRKGLEPLEKGIFLYPLFFFHGCCTKHSRELLAGLLAPTSLIIYSLLFKIYLEFVFCGDSYYFGT